MNILTSGLVDRQDATAPDASMVALLRESIIANVKDAGERGKHVHPRTVYLS